ncbi:MAG: hypothetical protein U1C74_02200 [Phenylobacterium sp.]|nr:hypothetical protein [Phenylobacterium sp.]
MLTDRQIVTISEGVALAGAHPDRVSEFELELIAEVGARFVRFGRDAVVTLAEWAALVPAVEGLVAAERRAGQLGLEIDRTASLARTRAA